MAKRLDRHVSQEVCPWNEKFALPYRVPEFAPREFIAGKDAAPLARDVMVLTPEEFSVAFQGSPMKRAKLRGLKRNATVVLGNVGNPDDTDVLSRALDEEDSTIREHAANALVRIRTRVRETGGRS